MLNEMRKQAAKTLPTLKRQKKTGQGVVEYAGALVIAAVVVSLVLSSAPNLNSLLFFQLASKILTLFSSYVPSGA